MADETLLNILIVDDSRDDRELFAKAFRSIGVTSSVRCVSGGNEAVRYIQGTGNIRIGNAFHIPPWIITDLKMDDGDGFTLLEELKSMPEYRVIPTVVMTGSADKTISRRPICSERVHSS